MTKPRKDYIRWLQEKAIRSARVLEMAKQGMSLAEIGRKEGISRQRVHQIVNSK